MKYWMYCFHEQNGEHEYTHRYIYSDKCLEQIGYQDENDDAKILSSFFGDAFNEDNMDSIGYWTDDGMRLVYVEDVIEVEPKQFETLELAGVYVHENHEPEKENKEDKN